VIDDKEVEELKSANRITGNLWVGAKPPVSDLFTQQGFDAIFFCAEEVPPQGDYGGVDVYKISIPDGKLDNSQQKQVITAASTVARLLQLGRKVLVTCALGVNRSALVAALALVMLGWDGEAAIKKIREKRTPSALFNQHFQKMILRVWLMLQTKKASKRARRTD